MAESFSLDLQAKPIDAHRVQMTITTNLPLPVEVSTGVSLASQKGDDVYVGHSEHVTLAKRVTVLELDTSKAQESLPSGRYDAEVNFFPRWGAENNSAAKRAPDLQASTVITLGGSGETSANALQKIERQRWVMNEVVMHTPWNQKRFVAKLGSFEKSPAELSRLHDAYYFAGADMTLVVNRVLNEVTIWRTGRASR